MPEQVPEKSAQIMVRLTPELLAHLKQASADEERTLAQTVRLAIRQYLERQGEQTTVTERTDDHAGH